MRKKLIMWEKENGYKGRFVARKLGISDSSWSKIKLGKQTPTLKQAQNLKSIFGIDDIFDLLKEEHHAEKT